MTSYEDAAVRYETVIDVGSVALLVYPAGDCDYVTVVALGDDVTVRLHDGRLYRTVPESIGLGVDDDLTSAVHIRGIRCHRAESTRDCRHGHRWDDDRRSVAVGL